MGSPRELKRMTRSTEALWWSLFAAGGMVAALLVPVHILLVGILLPLGWIPRESLSFQRMASLVAHPLVRVYLFVLLSLPFFHCAHRLRHTLYDLGLRGQRTLIAVACYGLAIAGTVAAGIVILALG